MSTILDALRRVENEKRRRAETAELHGEVVASGPQENPRRPRWLLGAALLMVLGLGIGLGLFFDRRSSAVSSALQAATPLAVEGSEPAESGAVSSPAASAPPAKGSEPLASAAPQRGMPPAEPRALASPQRPKSVLAAARPAGQQTPAMPSSRRTKPMPAPSPEPVGTSSSRPPEPIQVAAIQPPIPPPPAAPVTSVAPKRVAISKPAPPPVEAAPSRPIVSSEVKVVRRSAPMLSLTVVRTVWHPEAAKRVAHVESEQGGSSVELHEGEAWNDFIITEITPSGVLLERDGIEIKRRVGASVRNGGD